MNIWTNEEDKIIMTYYVSYGSRFLEKLIPNHSLNSIKGRARLLGLRKKINYTKDELFFEIPNTLNSSIAGLIASDGHIKKRISKENGNSYYSISVILNNKDIDFLYKVKDAVKSTYNIITYNHHYVIKSAHSNRITEGDGVYSTFAVFQAKKYVEDLYTNWNIPHGAKSLILEPPKNLIDLDVKLAYFCGLVNGDGSIGLTKDGEYDLLNISLIGTEKLLYWCRDVISEYFNENLGMAIRKDENSKTYTFSIRGYRAMKLFNKIRSLNCIFLDRKWNNPRIVKCIEGKRQIRPDLFEINNPIAGSELRPYKFHFIPQKEENSPN